MIRNVMLVRRFLVVAVCVTFSAGCKPGGHDAAPGDFDPPIAPTARTPKTMAPSSSAESTPDLAEGMRRLRLRALEGAPADFGLQPTDEFPKVYGALFELPLDKDDVLTIVSLRDGNASLYTRGKFGVIGGYAHDGVRTAAAAFVRVAQDHFDASSPTTEFPYPDPGRVRCYLLTFDGVRVIDTDFATLESGTNRYSPLFEKGNDVITELRKIVSK